MTTFPRHETARRVASLAALLLTAPASLIAQRAAPRTIGHDSVTVTAGPEYRAGGFHRFLFGGTYRDLWITPIRVPVLNLRTFDGGLMPQKEGGGFETKSLRLISQNGLEYVFRSVDKRHGHIPGFDDVGVVNDIASDQTSSSHPAANLVVASLLGSAGVLHESPVLVVMPDDPTLGKFRGDFANRLGTLALYPSRATGDTPGFADAFDIIDSDTLRVRLDRNPAERVDSRTFLAARLIDMLVNNWDRHPGQWKWARLQPGPHAPWEPISRDYDKAFISASGVFPGLLHVALPNIVTFDSSYPGMRGLTWNSLQFDQRLLNGLDKPTWDSVARALKQRITDSVIEAALRTMPPEYRSTAPALAGKLRARRDSLPAVADRFYRYLAAVVDIHATDAADRATITRIDDHLVEVRLESANGAVYFDRRFDATETSALRVYLHGGDDRAIVMGNVPSSIPIWIIGGNGNNRLVDSSSVGGRRNLVELRDSGTISDVVDRHKGELDSAWDRRPLVNLWGSRVPQGPDHGSRFSPLPGVSLNHDDGIVPRITLTKTAYGFGHFPYSSSVAFDARYSLKLSRYKIGIDADKRLEASPVHFTALGQVSQLELVNFHGFGNQAPQVDSNFYVARQSQWLLRPAVALSLGPRAELSLAAALQRSVTDTARGHFVSDSQPYGFGSNGNFGQIGVQLALHVDTRDLKRHAHHGNVVDLTASYYPAALDVQKPFEAIDGLVAQYLTFPIAPHPFLALRVGGRKVFGDFPFQEAAFLGGNSTIRTLYPQSYAGDALIYSTAELRIPVAKFTLLFPLNTGLLATEDVGRVYVKDASPGGWHYAFGAGFWVGFRELTADIRIMRAEDGRPSVIGFSLRLPARSGQ